ncbi:MAG TPA: hypothetical protein VFX76_14975 [Roseiflexaceae bacterium]|nr:hypothetical protein [Roseiflexaceae bacterium]
MQQFERWWTLASTGGDPMTRFKSAATGIGLLAALSMAATPLAAADFAAPAPASSTAIPKFAVFDVNSLKAERHRYWRHRDRIDAGDVLAGVLIIGGIAAIANAAAKSERNERYRERDYRYDREVRPDYRGDGDRRRSDGARGIDRARLIDNLLQLRAPRLPQGCG